MSLYLYLVFVSHAGENEYEQLNRQQLLDSNNADEEEVSGFNHKSFCLEIIQGGTADDTTDHSGKAYPCDKFPPQQPVSPSHEYQHHNGIKGMSTSYKIDLLCWRK